MGQVAANTFYFKISYSGQKYDLEENAYVYNRAESQKANGVVECELKSDKLIFGETSAKAVGEAVTRKYASGKSYIEAEWIGTAELKLGGFFKGSTREGPLPKNYECFSNEFTLDKGLRVRTKGREI